MFCRQHVCQLCLYVLLLQRPFVGRGLFCTVVCTFARMLTHAGVSVGLRYQAGDTRRRVCKMCAADGPAATGFSSCLWTDTPQWSGWQQPNRCCITHMLHTQPKDTQHSWPVPSWSCEGVSFGGPPCRPPCCRRQQHCRMQGPGQLNAGALAAGRIARGAVGAVCTAVMLAAAVCGALLLFSGLSSTRSRVTLLDCRSCVPLYLCLTAASACLTAAWLLPTWCLCVKAGWQLLCCWAVQPYCCCAAY